MRPHRLFPVAPNAIYLTVRYDWRTNTWEVRSSVVHPSPDGTIDHEAVGRYSELTAEEALDVASATLSTILDVPTST